MALSLKYNKNNKNHLVGITIGFFAVLYSIISLVNHYYLKTYALDLGAYTNAIYKYAHFKLADCDVFSEKHEYLLADHFDLYLILFSPLVYIFGTYTLLIVQIAAVLFGGYGVYRYLAAKYPDKGNIALNGAIYFYSFYGIYSAISFDYHSNVVAAMLVPWFFYFFSQNRFKRALVVLFFILMAKENMALWMLFICLGLLIEYRKSQIARNYLIISFLFSLCYLYIVINIIMPQISSAGTYTGFKYRILGNTMGEAFQNLLFQPVNSFKLLFINPHSNLKLDYVKTEMHLFVLLSGLFFLVLKPNYILMLLPVYFQKLYHNDAGMWGVGRHYSIEFAPVLAIGIFSVIGNFTKPKAIKTAAFVAIFGALAVTIRAMDNTIAHTNKSGIRFYQAAHYENTFDTGAAKEQLNLLPGNARVSTQSQFVPYLSLRNDIYQFPILKDAEYIVYNHEGSKYPLSDTDFKIKVDSLRSSINWSVHFESTDIVVLKRVGR